MTTLKQDRARRKRLKEECRKLWSQLIRAMYNNTCAWCGRKNTVQSAHHIQPKATGSIFLETHPMNGLLVCEFSLVDGKPSCHRYCDQHRDEVEEWLEVNLPIHYDFLSQTKNKAGKLPRPSYDEAREMLKKYIAKYKDLVPGIMPPPPIIPLAHMPPDMRIEYLKRKNGGIIVPEKNNIITLNKGGK